MTDVAAWPSPSSAMAPVPYRVRARSVENFESATICLEPTEQPLASPMPGQFMMLYAFGVGEIAMSVSGVPSGVDSAIAHTIRSVGAVSRALHDAGVGTVVGVRGPFGTDWGLESCAGQDLVIVAGGCGLAPLRPVITHVLAQRSRFGRVVVIAGARTPQHFLFRAEAAEWMQNPLLDAELIVDTAEPGWEWQVGLDMGWPPTIFASRWSGTCSAVSAGVGTVSWVRCCCAATGRSSVTTSPPRCCG
jgi:NAD(P)H-flavin reductase